MIEKIYESYDDCRYYISYNDKKLAYDNMSVIGGMLTFFISVSILFVALALAFSESLMVYLNYFPAIIILLILWLFHRFIMTKCNLNFAAVRVYALIVYFVVIIAFSIADASIYHESRACFFPAAILAITTLYFDDFLIMFFYKVLCAVVFILLERPIKSEQLIINDITVAILAIVVSTFCYSAVIKSTIGRKEGNEKLVEKSQTDLLTGLFNKVSFEEKCSEYLNKRLVGAKCTMFIFDLDDFKNVNDQYGHMNGDKVLMNFAEILKGFFHPDDIIGRVGGDEFMVLVLGEMPEDYAERRCRSIIHELKTSKVCEVSGQTCSIGIVEDTQGKQFEELYSMADQALYKAKEGGKARYSFYS